MQDLFYSSRSTSKRLPKVWCNRSVLHVLRHECMHRRFDLLKACAEHACEHNMRDLECFTHLMLFELHGLWLHDTSLLHAHCSSAEVLVVTIDPLQPWTAKPTKWRRSRRAPNLSTALHVSPPPPGKPLQVEAEDGGYGVVTCHDMYGDEEAFEEDLGMCIYIDR